MYTKKSNCKLILAVKTSHVTCCRVVISNSANIGRIAASLHGQKLLHLIHLTHPLQLDLVPSSQKLYLNQQGFLLFPCQTKSDNIL